MREIVTIQVGNYANFIGSHFWNFQDELLGLSEDLQSDLVLKDHNLDMDVFYRTGETQQGILTYSPRLVSVNYQGSLGSLSSQGTLYKERSHGSREVITWTGNVSTHASEPLKKNLFLQSLYDNHGKQGSHNEIEEKDAVECLESVVQYWTDFSKAHYHPQSLYELNGLLMDIQEFDSFGVGKEAYCGLRGEEINERLRFFIEECDHIQGIQFIADDFGGFSGVASEFMETIADDYTNVPVLLYNARDPCALRDPKSLKNKISSTLHDAISFTKLSSFCKLIVPVGLPSLSKSKASKFLSVEDKKPYHSSAIYASAIHSISLPFRMKTLGPIAESLHVCGAVDVNNAIQMLSGQGRQNIVTVLDASMPAPSVSGNKVEYPFLENLQALTPEIAEDIEDLQSIELMIVHGLLESGCQQASLSVVKSAIMASYESAITKPMFCHLVAASCPLPIPLPFPSIFRSQVGRHGEILESPIPGPSSRGSLDVHSIPMAARLRSSATVLPFLESRLGNLRKYGIQHGALGTELLSSWGFGKDDLYEIGEALSKMVTTLDPRPEVSSDSD